MVTVEPCSPWRRWSTARLYGRSTADHHTFTLSPRGPPTLRRAAGLRPRSQPSWFPTALSTLGSWIARSSGWGAQEGLHAGYDHGVMTAWSLSGGRPALPQVRRLVTAGLAMLLLGLFGACCSLPEHGGGTAAQVASVSSASSASPVPTFSSVSSVNAEDRAAASAVGCSEGEGHSAGEGARRSSAPSCTASEPELAEAPYEGRTPAGPGQVRSAEQAMQFHGASSGCCRSLVVLQV